MSFLGAPLGTLLGGVPEGVVGIRAVDVLRLELCVRQRRIIPQIGAREIEIDSGCKARTHSGQIGAREIEIVPRKRRQKLT